MILITGSTGFVGSSIAATLLDKGFKVLAVSRNDADGSRTHDAITKASYGLLFGTPVLENLNVCSWDDLDQHLDEVTQVWHCAAEMTYNTDRILESMHANVGLTTMLYERVAATGKCKRFNYVSTAYTSEMTNELILERLHASCGFMNAYQISKWSAENALSNMQRECGLDVTIFRPSIVVGDSRTGWSAGKPFGFYMFLNAFKAARRMELGEVEFALDADVCPSLVTIDSLTNAVARLTARQTERSEFEVVHCTGDAALSNEEILDIIGSVAGIRHANRDADNLFGRRLSTLVERNRFFANSTWNFNTRRLNTLLGDATWRRPVDKSTIVTLTRKYFETAEPRRSLAASQVLA